MREANVVDPGDGLENELSEEQALLRTAAKDVLLQAEAEPLSFKYVRVESGDSWRCGATLRLHRSGGWLQDFALFGTANTVASLARCHFGVDPDVLLTGDALLDVAAEVLNQLIGRVKEGIVRNDGVEPRLDTPTACGPDASEIYLHNHRDAFGLLVSSSSWAGELLLLGNAPKAPTVLAIEEALGAFEKFGDRHSGLIRVQRMLDEIGEALGGLDRLPSMRATIEWCTSRVGRLVNGVDRAREEQIRGRVHRELSELRRSLEALAAPPESTAFVLPDDEEMRELLEGFCDEAVEVLSMARKDIEQHIPHLTQNLFRAMHTIKGNAGFFGLDQVRDLAHSTENMLGLVRDSGHELRGDQLEAAERSVRLVSDWVSLLRRALVDNNPIEFQASVEEHRRSIQHAFETGQPVALCEFEGLAVGRDSGARKTLRISEENVAHLHRVEADLALLVERMAAAPSVVEKADYLTSIARSRESLTSTLRAMNTEPLTLLFSKIGRLIRETADRLGKLVRVEIFGSELEAPRHFISALSGPMVHLARNAVDHGLENGEERELAGKEPLARIELRAHWEKRRLVVEVSDDGRGISEEKVLAKARARGLVADGAELPTEDVFALLMEPGFSTAEKTTEYSGRGVGMDVVKREIENCGGTISISSVLGHGSVFRIELPEDPNAVEEEEPDEEDGPGAEIELEDAGEITFL